MFIVRDTRKFQDILSEDTPEKLRSLKLARRANEFQGLK